MKVTELLRGARGGGSLAHERGVPFVSCSVAVRLIGLLRISGKKKKIIIIKRNKKHKGFPAGGGRAIRFRRCKCVVVLPATAPGGRDSWFSLISVGTTTLCVTLTN